MEKCPLMEFMSENVISDLQHVAVIQEVKSPLLKLHDCFPLGSLSQKLPVDNNVVTGTYSCDSLTGKPEVTQASKLQASS